MRLLESFFGTGRDVCTDNFFTNYNLAKLLLQENLTLLGTRRHRREVPGLFNRKIEIYSSKFIFNHVNGICLVAYQAKKSKNPVMLLSSAHADNIWLLTKQKKQKCFCTITKEKEEWICLMKIWKNFHAEEKQLDGHFFFIQYY